MSRPPNPYRDQHRELEAAGSAASNRGDYAEATRLWRAAARLKNKGIRELEAQIDREKGRASGPA